MLKQKQQQKNLQQEEILPRAFPRVAVVLKQSTVAFYKDAMQVVHEHGGEIRRKKETNNKTHTKFYPPEISFLPDTSTFVLVSLPLAVTKDSVKSH